MSVADRNRPRVTVLRPAPIAGRVPPHDLDAEAAVLSAVMLSRPAFDEVATILKAEHFYSETNGRIYMAAMELAASNQPIDLQTVGSWLRGREWLQAIGGPNYLVQIADATPSVSNVAAHAKTVYDCWWARQIIATGQIIAGEGYGDYGTIEEYAERSEAALYAVARGRRASASAPIGDALKAAFDRIHAAAERGAKIDGTPTGFERYDGKTAGLHDGELIIVAARPGIGKTSLVCNMAINVASPRTITIPPEDPYGQPVEQHVFGDGVCIFSLEMPKEQLSVRMACSEGRVSLERLRLGQMQKDDWRRIAEATQYISSLPIWIDDTSSATLLHVRAEVRRRQAEYNREAKDGKPARRVGLVVVDYLQLMKGRDGVNSREQEISEISRGLKAMAKDLSVPVIALSQLNRSCETRSTKDKRPQLSDLRECLTGDMVVPDALTGDLVTIREIASGRRVTVFGLDERTLKVSHAPLAAAWSTGIRPVYKLRTDTGRVVRATANHPFLTITGWKRLDELRASDRIASPRIVPEPKATVNNLTADEARLIGYLISDGSYCKHRTVSYVKADPVLTNDVRRIAYERFGIVARDKPCQGVAEQFDLTVTGCGPGGNPLINWLVDLDIHGQLGQDKRVPKAVLRCGNSLLAIFLGALWAGDGSVVPRKSGGYVLKFSSTSMGLLDDVHWILTRLGIVAEKGNPGRNSKSTMDIATVSVGEGDAILRFAGLVPVPGVKGRRLAEAVKAIRSMGRNARTDRLPIEVTDMVHEAKSRAGMSWHGLGYRCQNKEMCRSDLAHVAKVLGNERLSTIADSDVLWDGVHSIVSDGKEETFDVRVPGLHNLIVNNVFTHNSGAIEQDADTVVLMYRESYYNPDDTDKRGVAELDIAKQRMGSTGRIYVRWDGACTRFDNIAAGDYPREEER